MKSRLHLADGLGKSAHPATIRTRYSIKEAAFMLCMSDRAVNYRIESGDLVSIVDGGRIFILHEELIAYAKRPHTTPIVPARAA